MSTKKSTFKITQMDCASEEQMIRMKLEGIPKIRHLEFDLPNRKLEVYHESDPAELEAAIGELGLGDELLETADSEVPKTGHHHVQVQTLWWVLAINFTFFLLEMIFGWISGSMGLIADSLDMLADSIVYGLSLFAIGATVSRKKKVAKLSGYLQMTLAVMGFAEVVRRFFGYAEVPVFETMIIIAFLALVGNAVSLYLIQKAKSDEVHMKASSIFTANDIVINLGVITAGVLVYLTSSRIPDLIIGSIVFLLVIRGAFRILKLSK